MRANTRAILKNGRVAINRPFGNVYEDEECARAYATLQFPGTYYLAFRDLPALIRRYNHDARCALDFGCGTGRSARFLRNLGLQVIGVDISQAMLDQARARDPSGEYYLLRGSIVGEFAPTSFDLILAAFTFDNIPTDEAKADALSGLSTLLAPDASLFLVVSSPAIYVNEWASFSTRDFPENRDARDGDPVRIVMLDVPDRRPVEDVLCTDAHYQRLFESARLRYSRQQAFQTLENSFLQSAFAASTFATQDATGLASAILFYLGDVNSQEPALLQIYEQLLRQLDNSSQTQSTPQ